MTTIAILAKAMFEADPMAFPKVKNERCQYCGRKIVELLPDIEICISKDDLIKLRMILAFHRSRRPHPLLRDWRDTPYADNPSAMIKLHLSGK